MTSLPPVAYRGRAAEAARFELARACTQPAFQASAIGQLGESSEEYLTVSRRLVSSDKGSLGRPYPSWRGGCRRRRWVWVTRPGQCLGEVSRSVTWKAGQRGVAIVCAGKLAISTRKQWQQRKEQPYEVRCCSVTIETVANRSMTLAETGPARHNLGSSSSRTWACRTLPSIDLGRSSTAKMRRGTL